MENGVEAAAPQKAYDLKVLASKLKDAGLNATEEVAKQVFVKTLEWVKESAEISTTPFDNLAVGVVEPLKDQVLKLIDKIDGQQG